MEGDGGYDTALRRLQRLQSGATLVSDSRKLARSSQQGQQGTREVYAVRFFVSPVFAGYGALGRGCGGTDGRLSYTRKKKASFSSLGR